MFINQANLLFSLSIQASSDQVHVLRATTRVLAVVQHLSMDDVADLVIAVDEAANVLVERALPSGLLTCMFVTDALGGLCVHLSTSTFPAVDISTSSSQWKILQMLVDDATVETLPLPFPQENSTATIILTKTGLSL